MDVARRDTVDVELNRLMEKGCSRETEPDEREALWQESVRRYNARRREENRLAWLGYFERLTSSLRSRAEEYDDRAQALQEDETS
jgi:predicted transcriptional regulator